MEKVYFRNRSRNLQYQCSSIQMQGLVDYLLHIDFHTGGRQHFCAQTLPNSLILELWASHSSNKWVNSIVTIQQTLEYSELIILIRRLVVQAPRFNFQLQAVHIPGLMMGSLHFRQQSSRGLSHTRISIQQIISISPTTSSQISRNLIIRSLSKQSFDNYRGATQCYSEFLAMYFPTKCIVTVRWS